MTPKLWWYVGPDGAVSVIQIIRIPGLPGLGMCEVSGPRERRDDAEADYMIKIGPPPGSTSGPGLRKRVVRS